MLGLWGVGSLGCWVFGVLGLWGVGSLGVGSLGCWVFGVLGFFEEVLNLVVAEFAHCSKDGAAACPSGMNAEHMKPLLVDIVSLERWKEKS